MKIFVALINILEGQHKLRLGRDIPIIFCLWGCCVIAVPQHGGAARARQTHFDQPPAD